MAERVAKPVPTVIFTDLDGTLLDRNTYSYQKALAALHLAQHNGIPIVFCSSKTRVEQMVYRKELGITDPFIVEDGGAIFIEVGYFLFHFPYDKTIDDHCVIELGIPYENVREAVDQVRSETEIEIKGYGDMVMSEVAELTGLDRSSAARAMKREYEETLVSTHGPEDMQKIEEAFTKQSLKLSKGGRFFSVSGQHDKGTAVDVLASLYRHDFGEVILVGIGDGHNDRSLFNSVDVPVLVQKEPNEWEDIEIPNVIRVDGIGPEGWSRFVTEYISRWR